MLGSFGFLLKIFDVFTERGAINGFASERLLFLKDITEARGQYLRPP